MKVLILVLATDAFPWKYIREEGQEKTWDAVDVPGVETLYYFSHPLKSFLYKKYLRLHCSPLTEMMHWRLKLALDYVWDMEWDFIFRASASSYIDKANLLIKAETLPREKCYCGIECCGGGVASGCGFFMSRDVADILRKQIPINMNASPYGSHPDDVLVGRILEAHGIGVTPGAERYDYYTIRKQPYHYRCRDDNAPMDGVADVKAMQDIWQAGEQNLKIRDEWL